MKYDPQSPNDRRDLAASLVQMLAKAKFVQVPSRGEDVYEFDCGVKAPGCKVQVFTSVVNGEAREVGADAIRVAGVYTTKAGERRGLASETRINRTGDITDITERVLTRMRTIYRDVVTGGRCPKCQAPLFRSRKNNMVCAEACWSNRPGDRPDADGFGNDNS